MTALLIDAVGPATSIQDIGRFGLQRFGLGTAGAMDRFSLAVANALVGSPVGAAAIEIGPWPMRLRAEGSMVRVALAGARRDAESAGRAFALGESILLQPGETLSIASARSGVFSYLAVEGGILADPVMGSVSTHARLGLGSPYPRALQAGDIIPVSSAKTGSHENRIALPAERDGPIGVVLGPQDDYFSRATIDQFLATDWAVSTVSDRMGYRLEGPPLHHARGHNIVSDGIALGAIQVLGNGLPLILLADRGPTGGYPKIATIITPDVGRCAQTAVGKTMRFMALSIEEAQIEAVAFARRIEALPELIAARRDPLSLEALFEANLAGEAVDALRP